MTTEQERDKYEIFEMNLRDALNRAVIDATMAEKPHEVGDIIRQLYARYREEQRKLM